MLMKDDDDMLKMMYAALVSNNDSLLMSYKVFLTFIQDKKVAKWMYGEYKRIAEFEEQIKVIASEVSNIGNEEKKSDAILTMTDIATSLIVQYGLDPHYVMDEMQLWEILPLFKAADYKVKQHLIEKRFWTYMTISPHLDPKKMTSPEKLIPFAWEQDAKKMDVDQGMKAAAAFFNKKQKQEDNGKSGFLGDIGPDGLCKGDEHPVEPIQIGEGEHDSEGN